MSTTEWYYLHVLLDVLDEHQQRMMFRYTTRILIHIQTPDYPHLKKVSLVKKKTLIS